jgi:exopolysaccharide biosynthesis polyprenyl glycosylphosphotransferase
LTIPVATEPILHPGARLSADQRIAEQPLWAERLAPAFGLLSTTKARRVLFLFSDIVAVWASHGVAQLLTRQWLHVPASYLNPRHYYLFYVPFFMATLYILKGYKSPDLRRPEKELEILFKGVSFSFVALACANFVLFKSSGFSRYLLIAWYVLTLLFLLILRFGLRSTYSSLWRRGLARQNAIFIGSHESAADFQRLLSTQRCSAYQITRILAGDESDEWESIARSASVQVVIVNVEERDENSAHLFEIIRACRRGGVEIEVYSRLFGTTELRFERDEFSGYLRFYTVPTWSVVSQRMIKASLDAVIGLIGSLFTIALTPVVALLIKLEDGGPVFFSQEYVGADGHIHYYRKFRTMVVNARQMLEDAPTLKAEFEESFKLKHDPRVLRVGRILRKYSLDEFPEFFSLLTGQLTFVGPRTISWAQRERYGPLLPKLLSVKPGLTGFWQVMGRQTTTYEERIQMDMFYIDHWSIWLDLVIIVKTFWEVLRANGAY